MPARELRHLQWPLVEFMPAPGKIVLEPGATKNKLARSMGMIGEIREALLMQMSIRDAKFPDCPYVFLTTKASVLGTFVKREHLPVSVPRSQSGKKTRSYFFTISGVALPGTGRN